MLLYTIALLLASAVLLAGNPGRAANRWASIFLFFAAIGGVADRIADAGYPALGSAVRIANLVLTPYAVAVFALVYAEWPGRSAALRRRSWLLLVPPAVSAAALAWQPDAGASNAWLLAWAAPYYAGSCALLVVGAFREADRVRRRGKLVTAAIMAPSLLAVLLFIYVARVFAPEFDYFRYVSLFFLYSFAAATLCLFVYGVLGVKLRVERDPMERAMEAASSGAHLLSHSIKNELGKIAISAENLRRRMPGADEEAEEQLERIERSSGHLLAMAERIHGRAKRIELRPEPCRLDRLAEEATLRERDRLDRQRIELRLAVAARPTLIADPVHLAEAIGNLLANAIEALPDGGRIELAVRRDRRGASLSVADDGPGVPPERVARVFEPFYSTKPSGANFGLGLSYVYNVMRESGGSVAFASKPGEGTRATLHFPASAVVDDD